MIIKQFWYVKSAFTIFISFSWLMKDSGITFKFNPGGPSWLRVEASPTFTLRNCSIINSKIISSTIINVYAKNKWLSILPVSMKCKKST